MASRGRFGLPVPRVSDAPLQRFLETVAELLESGALATREDVDEAVAGVGTAGTGTAPAPAPLPPDTPGLPVLGIPPKPEGVQVLCGINVCIVEWVNPFRIYANHALARVYRHTADEFNNAVEIGMAEWLLYPDDTVEAGADAFGQEYFYWVRFENTAGVLGPPSDSASGMTAPDPEAVYELFRNDLVSSPLAAALTGEPETPAFVTEEIRRIALIIATLTADAAAVLEEDVAEVRTELEALLIRFGPPQNRFMGADRDAAEDERDAYGAANPDWLATYDGDESLMIELSW